MFYVDDLRKQNNHDELFIYDEFLNRCNELRPGDLIYRIEKTDMFLETVIEDYACILVIGCHVINSHKVHLWFFEATYGILFQVLSKHNDIWSIVA